MSQARMPGTRRKGLGPACWADPAEFRRRGGGARREGVVSVVEPGKRQSRLHLALCHPEDQSEAAVHIVDPTAGDVGLRTRLSALRTAPVTQVAVADGAGRPVA